MKKLLTLTESGMLAYWAFAGAVAVGWIYVAPDMMYPDHTNPVMVNWNWSFLPIDVLFALCGLAARFVPMPRAHAEVLQTVSLALMFCAGLMAISFWTLQCWFDVAWWGMNLWLMGLGAYGLLIQTEICKGRAA